MALAIIFKSAVIKKWIENIGIFFQSVFAFFQILFIEIYEVLVDEFDWPSLMSEKGIYFFGNQSLKAMLNSQIDNLKPYGFNLEYSKKEGFDIQNNDFKIEIVDRKFSGLQFIIFVKREEVYIGPMSWDKLFPIGQPVLAKSLDLEKLIKSQLSFLTTFIKRNYENLQSMEHISQYRSIYDCDRYPWYW